MQQTQDTMAEIGELEKTSAQRVNELERNAGDQLDDQVFFELYALSQDIPEMQQFLKDLQEYILDNIVYFKETDTPNSTTSEISDLVVSRVSTAQTFAGREGFINIEREPLMSGRTHDKDVLILSGYLGAKFGKDRRLTLSASICFEQSYDGVDGDSASSTEIYAISPSLSGLPLRQDIAVTGSVNQRGEIQPIGEVNQKVEGMFDVCRSAGELTGTQGVVIPHQNVKNLMLREDVVEAIREDKFNVYAREDH